MKLVAGQNAYDSDFAHDVCLGLSQLPKQISSKYFYDARGSQLFDQITEQQEYYLTRTEKHVLDSRLKKLQPFLSGITEVIEFGPGDGSKAEIILRQLIRWARNPLNYMAVDISPTSIRQSLNRLIAVPGVKLDSFNGDYKDFALVKSRLGRLFLFLGSNIGNYEPDQARKLLKHFHSLMTDRDLLVIGFDKKKDISTLTAAYNDQAGITREFNFNLLDRMNNELGANFNRDFFSHHGIYNPLIGAMQSFLVSLKNQMIFIEGLNKTFTFDLGEAIHVENSYKYSDHDINLLADGADFEVALSLNDERNLFTDSVWRVKEK